MDVDGKQQMVYKHAISTIMPLKPISLSIDVFNRTPDSKIPEK